MLRKYQPRIKKLQAGLDLEKAADCLDLSILNI
jgi:hypothetical protein